MRFSKSSSASALPAGAAAARPTVPTHSSPLANSATPSSQAMQAPPDVIVDEVPSGNNDSSTSTPMRSRSVSPRERGLAPGARPPPSAFRSNRNSSGKGKEREQVARQYRPGRHPWLIDQLEARRNADLWIQEDRVILILGGELNNAYASAPCPPVANVYQSPRAPLWNLFCIARHSKTRSS